MKFPIIETERLILKHVSKEDNKGMFEWLGDKEVNTFMRYPLYTSLEQVDEWIEKIKDNPNEFGIYLKDGTLIGGGSISKNENGYYEVGYNASRKYWGFGYIQEAFKALMDYYHNELGVTKFEIGHADENIRSKNVAISLGFKNPIDTEYSSFDGKKHFKAKYYKMEYLKHENSYGAVIYKKENGKVYYLLEHMGFGHTTLPKGHIEEGETIEECVHREIYEELGIEVDVDFTHSRSNRYQPFDGIIKDCTYFIATSKTNEIKVDNNEVLSTSYLEYEDACNAITYEIDKKILKWAHDLIEG